MRKLVLVISLLLVAGLLISGCTSQTETTNTAGEDQQTTSQTNPEAYIDDELVDENSTIEIGVMI